MIIPVRCFTCGAVLADKWLAYERMCKEATEQLRASGVGKGRGTDAIDQPGEDGEFVRGRVLDDLAVRRICCRRHMLTHVDLIDII